MPTVTKWLLVIFVAGILGVIIMTWGSIGSVILTLALLLSAGMVVLKKVMDNRDPDDFRWEY